MKKHMRTTLGKKLLALYLVLFVAGFYFAYSAGYDYIYTKVVQESKRSLHDAGITLLNSEINRQAYTRESIRSLQTQFTTAAEVAECRILIIADDGTIVLDTSDKNPDYNIYFGDASFLKNKYNENFTLNGYLDEPSLCVTLPIEKNPYLNGYLVFTQANTFLESRADYYFNILMSLFYLIAAILGVAFLILDYMTVRPLRELRDGAKDFSIAHENPPINIQSNDEYGELAQTLNLIGEELSKFDEYQRKFISNISHDFRSPLTNIQGYVQAMADGIIPPEDQGKYLNIILFETERLTKLTSNLLDLHNYDRDNIFLDIRDFDIHHLLENILAAQEVSARKKDIHLDVSLARENPLMVSGDADKIHLVLQNLVENAIKFSDNNSTVYIRTRTKGDRVFVSVKDTGIGIPKKDLGSIWDRFYKTDLSRGKDKLGTGLGLSICKEIITAHKQTIDVVSTEGVGSEFIFTLSKS